MSCVLQSCFLSYLSRLVILARKESKSSIPLFPFFVSFGLVRAKGPRVRRLDGTSSSRISCVHSSYYRVYCPLFLSSSHSTKASSKAVQCECTAACEILPCRLKHPPVHISAQVACLIDTHSLPVDRHARMSGVPPTRIYTATPRPRLVIFPACNA